MKLSIPEEKGSCYEAAEQGRITSRQEGDKHSPEDQNGTNA